ncbi:hypothetical protein [Yoonia sp. BS5-3]|uniref:Uncharacterized protein n=1 Tax=Yoonia phaeophyticola TaxID=3137369 RepID=A0ABZ2V2M5_9RHOB
MLNWLYHRNQRKRIAFWTDVLSDFEASETTAASDYDAIALTYPVVILGLSEKLALPAETIYAPRDISIQRRLLILQFLDKEAERIAAINESDESLMLYCHDLLHVLHRACYHHADQPHIEPEASRAIADRAIDASCRLFERGNRQIALLNTGGLQNQPVH